MPIHRFAAGVIIFKPSSDGSRKYLVIQNAAGHWELPKGHTEPGEHWRQTALRELAEETGITDVTLIPNFARQIKYVFRDRKAGLIHKTVCFALARTKRSKITLSDEHTGFAFLDFQQAIQRLTHAATRGVLQDAENFLAHP